MEKEERKFKATLHDKSEKKRLEVQGSLSGDELLIETERPIKIPIKRIKDVELFHAIGTSTEVKRVANMRLSYYDDVNSEHSLSFEMDSLEAVDTRDFLRSAMGKVHAEAWALLPVEKKVAGFWIRFLASFIDGIILFIIGWIIAWVIGISQVGTYINWLICIAYTIGFWTWRGQTPGKMIVGIKIIKTDESPIGFATAILRYIGYVISTIILFIGYFMIAWDSKKQGLHDKIAGTYVIKLA